MNSKAIKIMLALSALLLLILLIEWQVIGLPETDLLDTEPTGQEYKNDEKELSAIILINSPLTSYADMVERPLFIKGRRNVSAAVEESVNLEASKIEDLTLVGIFSIEDRLIAAFSKQGAEKKFVKRSTNESIAGWTLKEVLADQVIFEKGSREKTLLLRAPKEKVTKKVRVKPKPLMRKIKKPKF